MAPSILMILITETGWGNEKEAKEKDGHFEGDAMLDWQPVKGVEEWSSSLELFGIK